MANEMYVNIMDKLSNLKQVISGYDQKTKNINISSNKLVYITQNLAINIKDLATSIAPIQEKIHNITSMATELQTIKQTHNTELNSIDSGISSLISNLEQTASETQLNIIPVIDKLQGLQSELENNF